MNWHLIKKSRTWGNCDPYLEKLKSTIFAEYEANVNLYAEKDCLFFKTVYNTGFEIIWKRKEHTIEIRHKKMEEFYVSATCDLRELIKKGKSVNVQCKTRISDLIVEDTKKKWRPFCLRCQVNPTVQYVVLSEEKKTPVIFFTDDEMEKVYHKYTSYTVGMKDEKKIERDSCGLTILNDGEELEFRFFHIDIPGFKFVFRYPCDFFYSKFDG